MGPGRPSRARRGTELRLADLAYGRPSFSQFGEDRALANIFAGQQTGFYVDVGAYAPQQMSNTYLLYRQGWRGINLEPDPQARAEIERVRPRDLTLPYAVSLVNGSVEFVLEGSFSGINDNQRPWSRTGHTVPVISRPLADILAEYLPNGQRIDLLDVDCEGHDLDVLRSNDWERFRPRVVLAEWHAGTDVPDLLSDLGYHLSARLELTGLFTDTRGQSPA